MTIQQQEAETKGSFFVEKGDIRLAEMTYSKAGARLIIIDHTDVSDELRGQGAGKQLVEAAVLYARKNKIRILPLCPFARSVFDKTPEWSDILS
jgi:hypothetical protein